MTIARPRKIVCVGRNYREHAAELGNVVPQQPLLFLKPSTAVIGDGDTIVLPPESTRVEHEAEIALVIGRRGNKIPKEKALGHVCAYSIGLDMTVRGPELQCFRKSIDTYSVLGPWLVTADEIGDPNDLDLSIMVNGELRQNSNTKFLVYNVERLIEFASAMYTLHPGDIIMTGTPAGVSPVKPGDLLHAYVQGVGESDIRIAPAYA